MAYWHMQLHPDDLGWKREEELLEELSLIGLGLASDTQTKNFIKNINLKDIILVKRGSKPIALVEIEGEVEDNFENDISALDWFRYRRKVKVLDIFNKTKLDSADKPRHDFPSPRGTLTISKDKTSPTYQYILNWHKSLYPELYQTDDSLKIREVSIFNYKIFKEFKIDFTDEKNKPLPIVVVAGINGSGKTTLLEYIKYFTDIVDDNDRSYLRLERYDKQLQVIKIDELRFYSLWNIKRDSKEESFLSKLFKEKTIYFPTGTDITDLKVFIAEYVKEIMHKENLRPSDVFDRIREDIDKIFKDLELLVKFDKVDANGNVFFRNKKGEDFSIDNISTGEKTLLSKVLYLYLKKIKDSVILIDEPELSLHPAWQNRVLKLYENFAKENNCQIIIATHSPHIIGSAKSEYIRLLTEDGVVDSFSNTYGAKFSQILTDIMGVRDLRTPEINEKFSIIENMIAQNKFDTKEFKTKWQELENILGKNYFDLKLLKLEIASRRKNVQNNKK
jgi:AAA15 family ATPase/GTPase